MGILYTILVHLSYFILWPVSFFNPKVRQWVKGRARWRKSLTANKITGKPVFWFHSASLGEFEQGLPVIEALKNSMPRSSIVITFFSPSGYEIKKNYSRADLVTYLPLDTPYNARDFLDRIRPDAVFFIKYEFWFFYLQELGKRHIPVFLLSALFRPEQVFFRWYGSWYRKHLLPFRHFFVQNSQSADLLKSIGFENVSITGDTRFDRVKANAARGSDIPVAREFAGKSICVVAGSTWPADETILANYINNSPADRKFIIAPHEISQVHISRLMREIRKDLVLFSLASVNTVRDKQVLIMDNIGMLSVIYRYGKIAYVGGGFGKGIHNVLEAAVYGIPVIFGPNHQKHKEAHELIAAGGGFSVETEREFGQLMEKLLPLGDFYTQASARAETYVLNNTGSASKIMAELGNALNWEKIPAL